MIELKNAFIIPDIHQNKKFLSKGIELAKKLDLPIVFLGDYFDVKNISDKNVVDINKFCNILNEIILDPYEKYFILGNHDVPALAHYYTKKNPGDYADNRDIIHNTYSFHTCEYIAETIHKSFWDNINLFVRVGNYYCSHAGYSEQHADYNNIRKDTPEQTIEWMQSEWEKNRYEFCKTHHHWVTDVGYKRLGNAPVGGPLWLDFNNEPINTEVPQIVGHTRRTTFLPKNAPSVKVFEHSICLDSGQNFYGIVKNGRFEAVFA